MENQGKYKRDDVIHVIVELIKWCMMYGHLDKSETPFYNTYSNYIMSSNGESFKEIGHDIAAHIARAMDIYYHVYKKEKADVYIKSDKIAYSYGILLKRFIIAEHIYFKWNNSDFDNIPDNIEELYEMYPNWMCDFGIEIDDLRLLIDQLPIIINSIEPFKCPEFDGMIVRDVKKIGELLRSIQNGCETLYNDIYGTIEESIKYNEKTYAINGFKDEYLNDIFKHIVSYHKNKLRSNLKPENPIKNNRIINDKTFATRFKSFLQNITACDAASDDELEYLKMIADKLLNFQIYSASDKEEIDYLNRLYLKEK
jgi:hypothetical protein